MLPLMNATFILLCCAMHYITHSFFPANLNGVLGYINLIISFSSPLEFFSPNQGCFIPLVAECSYPAPSKVSTLLEQSKKLLSHFS